MCPISSKELVQLHLEHIGQVEPQISAIFVTSPWVLDAPKEADATLARGEICGPLHSQPNLSSYPRLGDTLIALYRSSEFAIGHLEVGHSTFA